MDILRVAQHVHPDRLGGASYHVHALSRDQAAMGHDVTVLTTTDDPSRVGTSDQKGYTVERVSAGPSPLGNDLSPAAIRYLRARHGSVDIVHAHSHLYFLSTLAGVLSGSTPVVLTNHGLYSQRIPKRLFDIHLRTLGRFTLNRADRIFTYTEIDRDRLRSRGVTVPIDVIPNGIDVDRFTPDGPTMSFTGQGPNLLFAGRLVEGKRPGLVIDAMNDVLEHSPDATLHIVGEGPLEPTLRSQRDQRLPPRAVSFHGHVPYDEMPSLLRSVDVTILPSRVEGLPRILLESLACGTPIVATDLPTIPESFASCGRLINSPTAPVLADAILELLSSDRRHLGERGRTLVTTAYNWANTADRTTTAIAAVCEANR